MVGARLGGSVDAPEFGLKPFFLGWPSGESRARGGTVHPEHRTRMSSSAGARFADSLRDRNTVRRFAQATSPEELLIHGGAGQRAKNLEAYDPTPRSPGRWGATGEGAQDLLGLGGAQAQGGGALHDLVVLPADEVPVDRLETAPAVGVLPGRRSRRRGCRCAAAPPPCRTRPALPPRTLVQPRDHNQQVAADSPGERPVSLDRGRARHRRSRGRRHEPATCSAAGRLTVSAGSPLVNTAGGIPSPDLRAVTQDDQP